MSSLADGDLFLVWPSNAAGMDAAIAAQRKIYANWLRWLSAQGSLYSGGVQFDTNTVPADEDLMPMDFSIDAVRGDGVIVPSILTQWADVAVRAIDLKHVVKKPIDALMTGVQAGYAVETLTPETWFPKD